MNAKNWICSPQETGSASVCFVKEFSAEPSCAGQLSVTAIGLFEAYLNGRKLGRGVLAPGYTQYEHQLQVMTYDLTGLLRKHNKLEITAAPGWAVGHLGYQNGDKTFSDHYSINAELVLTGADGKKKRMVTDPSFEVITSPVKFSDIYNGETHDYTAPVRKLGHAVRDASAAVFPMVPVIGPDIVEHERFAPVELIHTPNGELVLDFGQNMTGYVEFSVKGKRGDRIVYTVGEVLDRDGNFYNANYRSAENRITFVLDGRKRVVKPRFTFHGFRYVRLNEFPGEPDLSAIRAIAVYSDIKRTGFFSCGNEKINQLYHNTLWGQRSNYLDIPTDCPQRDERLGWTGDAQVFCRTAALNFDVHTFFRKWLSELCLDQRADGAVYGTCPERFPNPNYHSRVSAAWGDAATVCPIEIYRAFGDRKLLRDCFNMMKRWVEYQHNAGSEEYLWLCGRHYGDWLAMDNGEDSYVGATSTDLIASAFFAHSTDLLILAGEELGEDMSEYRALRKKIGEKFHSYFMENGMPKEKLPCTEQDAPGESKVDKAGRGITQTALVLILHFNLCLPEERAALGDRLEALIHEAGDRMTTGFVGTPYLLHTLTEIGKTDLAYRLLLQECTPSWLYSVNNGATTMWEHWNGLKEDGSFWSTSMNSFNHYAYGSVCDWLYGQAAGVTVCDDGAGYRKFTLTPHPSRALGFVNCRLSTVRGVVESNWYYKGDDVYFEFTVPQGATALLTLPNGYTETLGEGSYHYTVKG